MESVRLSHQMNAYLQWRELIHSELGRYRGWLIDHNLQTPELEARLAQAMQTLKQDKMTMAFVGEYSRGKTELINALFLSHYGARILPSGAGRTTMCPTEIYYDGLDPHSYIRLLPIETRSLETSLNVLKKQPDQWTEYKLAQQDPQQLKELFAEVANTKSIPEASAAAMGFQPEAMEKNEDKPGEVFVPAWRHALISIDHPLLAQGLVIIDTPGLNALGCEPELTFSLLPEAQCILLLLSAAAGVSATDLSIWNQHIHDLATSPLRSVYAVLNKIDAVWDELENEQTNQATLDTIRQQCAKQLQLNAEEIICVSAKEGLLAQVSGNLERLNRSNLPELEHLLSHDLMARKAQFIQHSVINDIHGMLHASRKTLMRRRFAMASELSLLSTKASDRQQQLKQMISETEHQQRHYQKRIAALKNNLATLKHDATVSLKATSKDNLARYLEEASHALDASWTVMGMNSVIDSFFGALKKDMVSAAEHQIKHQDFVASVYAEFEAEQSLAPMHYPRFDSTALINKLDDLTTKSGNFGNNLKKLLTEQKSTSKRFLTTVLNEGSNIYQQFHQQSKAWLDNALLPLFQITQEQIHLLEDNLSKLHAMESRDDDGERAERLQELIKDIDDQLKELDEMVKGLRQPAPY